MKTIRRLGMVLTAAVALAASGSTAWAQNRECGLVGSWFGYAGGSMAWSGVHTAGSKDARNGEMLLNFNYVGYYLLHVGNSYPTAAQMMPGHGVFEQANNGPNAQYKYTWYSYGADMYGNVLYSVRVKGLAQNTTCDAVSISFTYEVFDGWVIPSDMATRTPVYTTADSTAAEMRLPLVTP